jgi:hypothetical protein
LATVETERVALYARVSTHDQQTLPMQFEAMRAYAELKGWTIASTVEEVLYGVARCSCDDRSRGCRALSPPSEAAFYWAQLAEIERAVARGQLPRSEAYPIIGPWTPLRLLTRELFF